MAKGHQQREVLLEMEDINKGKCHSESYERVYSLWGTNKRPDFDSMFKLLLRLILRENREIYRAKAKLMWFSLTTYIQVLKSYIFAI